MLSELISSFPVKKIPAATLFRAEICKLLLIYQKKGGHAGVPVDKRRSLILPSFSLLQPDSLISEIVSHQNANG